MGGPRTISDILGIEIGRGALRGVLLNEAGAELTAAVECVVPEHAINADGVIDPLVVAPVLEELLAKLDVRDRSGVRVGLSVGPKNSGVGSGPAMVDWLETQAATLREPLRCAGGLGVAFAPSRAVDAVVKLASEAGIDLARIDFAPVAAARAIGDQVEDLICIGSGHGWQARMRDFEVLEAMENGAIAFDAPLHIVAADGQLRSISRYGWVEVSPELDQRIRLDIGQFATAVGAAIGVAYESPADLLVGKTVGCLADQQTADRSLEHLAAIDLTDGAESTLQLHPRQSSPAPEAQRTPRQTPTTSLSPLRRSAAGAVAPLAARAAVREEAPVVEETVERQEPAVRPETVRPPESVESVDESNSDWEDSLHVADPITMFSPDTEVEQMMGKRDRRLSIDVFIALLVISLIALGVAYFVL
ncbi:MAG: hypothetical protein ACRBK7_30325 [Acidimicrobiales bacterium]